MAHCWFLNPVRVDTFKALLFSFPEETWGRLPAPPLLPVRSSPACSLQDGGKHWDNLSLDTLWETRASFVLLDSKKKKKKNNKGHSAGLCGCTTTTHLSIWGISKRASGVVFYVLKRQEESLGFKTCSCVCSAKKVAVRRAVLIFIYWHLCLLS